MIYYKVPFIPNPSDRCVPATIGMVLAYFEPDKKFTMPELEKFCGHQPGKGAWPFKHMLGMAKRGYQIKCIEDFDLPRFAKDPTGYLKQLLRHNPEALEFQLTHSDLPAEAARAKQCLDGGLHFEHRRATFDDIRQLLNDGWLIRLEINARTLMGKPGYDPHSVLAVGYDATGVIVHNPGNTNNQPNQHIAWDLFEQAWKEYGGSYSLYGFKKERTEPQQ